ncbi:hypothetical protein [Parafrankia sp. FMc2]|uniref:hypothetical protein n=1 Tax=Parafrankia sp. FMc2 TaxID=3233196 RepID=UPI0034D40FF6
MSRPTRRQKQRKILVGCAVIALPTVWLSVSVWWFAIPLYLVVVLAIRLTAWPTICKAYRTAPDSALMCENLVYGTATGCGHHREFKRRDLWAVTSPRHPLSPAQTGVRLLRGHRRAPAAQSVLIGAPEQVTFRNVLALYAMVLCAVVAGCGIAVQVLAG